MAKTSPMGVRFDKDLLDYVKETGEAKSPQTALIIYENAFREKKKMEVKSKSILTLPEEIEVSEKETDIIPTFSEILNLAKSGSDKKQIDLLMSKAKLSPGQVAMIVSRTTR